MNTEMINILLNSPDISSYIYNLSILFLDIDINILHKFIFLVNTDDSIKVVELEFYVSVNNINKILEHINSIKYNTNIEIYPDFQYIKLMILKLQNILIELLELDKKTKTLLISAIETNNIETAKYYHNFVYYVDKIRDNYKPSDYNSLDYNVLNHIIRLDEFSEYVKNIYNYLTYSFNLYILLYCSNITTNIYTDINVTKLAIKKDVDDFLSFSTSIIVKYWSDYIASNKESIIIQSLIENIDCIIIKAIKNKDVKNYLKLKDIINVLLLLVSFYDDDITYRLIKVVNFAKNQLFLLSISNVIDVEYQK